MMNFFMGNPKDIGSPEDHLVGMVTSRASLVVSNASSLIWLVDIGASDHICYSSELLTDITPLSTPVNLALPNGKTILVHQTGTNDAAVPSSPVLDTPAALSSDVSRDTCDDSLSDWHNLPPDEDTLVNLQPMTDILAGSNEHFIRKSTRDRKPPSWWTDYQVNSVQTSSAVKYPFSGFFNIGSFSPPHAAFFTKIVQNKEPLNFSQAVLDPRWIEAMNKELDALESNNTWTLVTLPPGKQTIWCRWVFKIKYLANGDVDRFKARLVAKGYTQEPGVDFHDTFAPVAKRVTVKSVMAVSASKHWPLFQLDINNAFLHGDLNEEVNMDLPQGYIVDAAASRLVCSIKDLGQAKYYLGLKISRSDTGLFLSQHKFIIDMLSHTNLLSSKPLSIPLDQNTKLYDNVNSGALVKNSSLYRSLVGKLYLTFTRPDISFSVHLLSQFMHAPREKYLDALFRVLRYLKCTAGMSLFFPVDTPLQLRGFCDSDWGDCTISGRFVTGFCLLLGSSLISWQAKKQTVTSQSTAGAEYHALASITTEIMWLKYLLADLLISFTYVVEVFCDNQATIDIANNPVQHARTKHIELDCHFIREKEMFGLMPRWDLNSLNVMLAGYVKAAEVAEKDF
ncbi:hypothetical protein AgCh_015925 [Apium graveolens]